jgi:virginiamycin B lyase
VVSRFVLIAIVALAAGCTEDTADPPTTSAESTSTSTVVATTSTEPTTGTTESATTTSTQWEYLPAHELTIEAFAVPSGSRPHDVAPGADGGVWYTAQGSGELGWLDPATGDTVHVPLGSGSRPHGVIVDDQGTPWITDGGLNAIVSVDPQTEEVVVYPLPDDHPNANLNTATFDGSGLLWFTGQDGVYGSLDPASGEMTVYEDPEGRGPYGITATPSGSVFYASLAGSHIASIGDNGSATVHEPPTPDQGARRVWSDSQGAIWVSEWNSGNLSRYSPETGEWATWPLPGDNPAAYAVYVDEADIVWASDFGANAMVRFDPVSHGFTSYPLPHDPGEVRQILGRPGEVWAGESAADHLILIRTR